MRAKLFLKNGIIILIVQIISYAMDFVRRTVFIHTLSMEFLGIKGLLSNILSILALAELGIGTALVYCMYEPLARNDRKKIVALIQFYRKAYIVIACVVGGAGVCLCPFLTYLIKDCPQIEGLYLIYLLYLLNSVCSYLLCSKAFILIADQKLYVSSAIGSALSILCKIIQIVVLLFTRNFFLYLLIQPPFTLLSNFLVSRAAQKMYPYLNTKEHLSIPKEEKKIIARNTFATFNHRVGHVILNSTDNLIISRFVGLSAVAINDNYALITSILGSVFNPVFNALTAGVGNLNATDSTKNSYRVFKILHFANFWFCTFCCTCLFVLLNPFIELVWGKVYLFDMPVVIMVCANFYIAGIRRIPLIYKESMGLLWQDRFKPLLEALINLLFSMIAVFKFGVFGVFVGTFISVVSTSLWVEPYILFKYGLKISWKEFWIISIRYYLLSFLLAGGTYFVGNLYHGTLFMTFLTRLIICLIVPNLLIFLLFHRTDEWKELWEILRPMKRKTGESGRKV